MTDFRVMVLDKLSSNFEKNKIKDAEVLTNKLFDIVSSGGSVAVEEFLLGEINAIIENSDIDLSDIEDKLDDF